MAYPKGFTLYGIWNEFTEEEAHACAKATIPEDDHSCGCDGTWADACAWCDDDRAKEWLDNHRKGN